MSVSKLFINDAKINENLVPTTTTTTTTNTSDDSENESNKEIRNDLLKFIENYLKQLKLVFQSILPDLKSFKSWQIIILLFYGTFNVVFSILDFDSFFFRKEKQSLFKWTNDLNDGVPLWRRILLCLSGVSAFTNVLNVVLVIHGKISAYFWGITGAILYGSYAFAYGYVGDAQLSVFFFLPMQFVGIYIWSKELDNKSTTRVKSLTLCGWIFIIIISIFLIFLFYYEIPMFSKLLTRTYLFEQRFLPHLLDAITNGLSVIGQLLLVICYWEQYIMWTIVNLMLIVMYSGFCGTTRDINLLVVWIMLTINSSCGLYTWYRRWRKHQHSLEILNIKV